jgi:hypothetical protein
MGRMGKKVIKIDIHVASTGKCQKSDKKAYYIE